MPDNYYRMVSEQQCDFNATFRAKHNLKYRLWGNDNIKSIADMLSACLRGVVDRSFYFHMLLYIRRQRAARTITGAFRRACVRRRVAIAALCDSWIKQDTESRGQIRRDGRTHDMARLQTDSHHFAVQFVPDELKLDVVERLYWEKRRTHFGEWLAWYADVRTLTLSLVSVVHCSSTRAFLRQ